MIDFIIQSQSGQMAKVLQNLDQHAALFGSLIYLCRKANAVRFGFKSKPNITAS